MILNLISPTNNVFVLNRSTQTKLLPEAFGILPRDKFFNNKIALTFDDGIRPGTEAILNVLKKVNDQRKNLGLPQISATFFILGHTLHRPYAKKLLNRMIREGHVIGFHGYYHEKVNNPEKIKYNFQKTQNLVNKLLNPPAVYEIKYLRPFRGNRGDGFFKSGSYDQAATNLRKALILWQINSEDYLMYPERLNQKNVRLRSIAKAKEKLHENTRLSHGGVLLFHDTHKSAIILADFINDIENQKLTNNSGRFDFTSLANLISLKYKK